MSMTAALLYTRVSTDEQADADTLTALGKKGKKTERNGLSLPTQLAEVRRYVLYQDGWAIEGDYQDVLSGQRSDRPGYQALLARAKELRAQGRRVAIVVAALDRLGRDIHERVRVWKDLSPDGVEFHSCRDGGLVSEFTFNILASLAREEVRRLGERVTAVRRELRGAGWKAPGRAAWGYRWRDATEDEQRAGAPSSVLEPDPETAPFVREAFERAARGESVRSISRWVAALPDEVKGGRRMSYRNFRLIFVAPVYAARPDEGAEDVLSRPVGRWAPLVSDDTWRAVQAQIAGHQQRPRQASGTYLLTGLLRCTCGHRMCGASNTHSRVRKDGTRGTWRAYRCEARMLVRRNPDGGALECDALFSQARLDEAVSARVEPLLGLARRDQNVMTALRKVWRELQAQHAPDPGLRARIGQLERTAQKARQRMKNATLLLVDGTLDREGYADVKAQVEHDLSGADEELARLKGTPVAPTLPSLDEVLRLLDDWSAAWRSEDVSERREVISALAQQIVPVKLARGVYEPDVTWTEIGLALRKATPAAS